MTSFWWVNQGRSGDVELQGSFIWAPQKNDRGQTFHHWTNVSLVRSGDIVLHYSDGLITHIGIAEKDSYPSNRPREKGMDQWAESGWRCDLALTALNPSIPRSRAVEVIRKREHAYSPINSGGTVNQGYLFRILEQDVADLILDRPEILSWLQSKGVILAPISDSLKAENMKSSLIPKPLLILAGISGTGKTRWVREIALATRNLESDRNGLPNRDNFCLIPVRPDWHEPSDLLGYTSRISAEPKFIKTKFLSFLIDAWRDAWQAEASLNPRSTSVANMTPHWLCLDEMNLAPVEQYFADYLSVIESRSWDSDIYSCDPILSLKDRSSDEVECIRNELIGDSEQDQEMWKRFQKGSAGREAGIPLPPNLIVVGTVNMDETTHAFSRKVLDRAFTVEFDPDDICGVYAGNAGIDPVLGVMRSENTLSAASILSTTTSGKTVSEPIRSKVEGLIKKWNEAMAESPFRVAFRTLNEALLYAASKGEDKMPEALDGIMMMKLLPRLEGDSEKLGIDGVQVLDPVEELDKLAEAKNSLIHAAWQVASKAIGIEAWPSSKSHKKLHYMAKRLARTGYTSFWP